MVGSAVKGFHDDECVGFAEFFSGHSDRQGVFYAVCSAASCLLYRTSRDFELVYFLSFKVSTISYSCHSLSFHFVGDYCKTLNWPWVDPAH